MAQQHLSALDRISVPSAVAGVYDRASGCAEEFARKAGSTSYRSIEELIAKGRPDIVHVCTPPAAHFDAAWTALDHGVHVYVEKPFALTAIDAERLLDLARRRGRLVCAGHQLLRDRAFEQLLSSAGSLGTIVQIDSHFAFRPVGPPSARTGPRALASQAVDILPHPLYTLIHAMERFAPRAAPVELAWAQAGTADVQAVLRAGELTGRLSVSLRARPVASSLTITGTEGALTCDFVRSIVVGAGNSGTEALEKILNPMVEGTQLIARTAVSLGRRFSSGGGYPGLAELIAAFYLAVLRKKESPVPAAHLETVSTIFERLVSQVDAAASSSESDAPAAIRPTASPFVVVTGARGFLGSRVAGALQRVRGVGRLANRDQPNVTDWVAADLSAGLPVDALAGANVVVHAAAETAGGFEAHQRNTIDATRHLLEAMHSAGVRRLVLVSSLSVLRPPRTSWERQTEKTPRPDNPRTLGAYVWGKSRQEEIVENEAATLGISTRIVRPGALVDWNEPELPGLMGRRLFGRWHLGLGRPGLPIAICDVSRCAEVIAWCATHFDEAPEVVNLFDPSLATRAAFLRRLRLDGWNGRVVWVPISVLSVALIAARSAISLMKGRRPERVAAWSILRPRHYDARLATTVLEAARRNVQRAVPLHA